MLQSQTKYWKIPELGNNYILILNGNFKLYKNHRVAINLLLRITPVSLKIEFFFQKFKLVFYFNEIVTQIMLYLLTICLVFIHFNHQLNF